MAQTYAELRKLTKDQLVQYYDHAGETVQQLPLTFVRQEIAPRDLEDQNTQLVKMTRRIELMTVVITVATIVNVVLFAVR